MFYRRTWSELPNLPVSRLNHGCGSVIRGGNTNLVVFGGSNTHGSEAMGSPIKSILFLDLSHTDKGWYSVGGIWLGGKNWFIKASVINRLDETGCDLMFVTENRVRTKN